MFTSISAIFAIFPISLVCSHYHNMKTSAEVLEASLNPEQKKITVRTYGIGPKKKYHC